MKTIGKLYLIPVTLASPNDSELAKQSNPFDVLPETIKRTIEFIDDYIVENEKTARKFIKSVLPEKAQASLRISTLNQHLFHPNKVATFDYVLQSRCVYLMWKCVN